MEILNVLYDTDVFYYTLIKANIKGEKPVIVPYYILISDKISGGLSCPRPGEFAICRMSIPDLPKLEMIKYAGDLGVPTMMTDDWLKVLNDKIINVTTIKSTLVANNYSEILNAHGLGVDYKSFKEKWIY